MILVGGVGALLTLKIAGHPRVGWHAGCEVRGVAEADRPRPSEEVGSLTYLQLIASHKEFMMQKFNEVDKGSER